MILSIIDAYFICKFCYPLRTFSYHKNLKKINGFTLVELIVVIAIIAILSIAAISIDFKSVGWVQKEGRFTESVIAMIRDERIRNISGKGVAASIGSKDLIFPTETRITLSKEVIKSEYFSGSILMGIGTVFTKPFFGETGYIVGDLSGTFLNGTPIGATNTGDIISIKYYPGKDLFIQYIGTNPCPEVLCTLIQAELTTGFNKRFSTLTIDSRSGVVQKK